MLNQSNQLTKRVALTFWDKNIQWKIFIKLKKYRHNHKPLISASKAINLVGAIMSMFILQIAMVNEFGNMNDMKILNILSGAVTSMSTIGVAIYMLVNSKNKTKN